MDLYDAMSTLQAVRRLKPDPILGDVLDRVLKAATWAPSGGNRQCWRIIVVRDLRYKRGLEKLYKPHWSEYTKGYEVLLKNLSGDKLKQTKRGLEAGKYVSEHMHKAPVIFVFCFNPSQMTITDKNLKRPSVVGGAQSTQQSRIYFWLLQAKD